MDDLIDAVALSLWWADPPPGHPRGRRVRTRDAAAVPGAPGDEAIGPDGLVASLAALGVADATVRADALRAAAVRALARARAAGARAVPRGGDTYPIALADIPDAPPVLWTRGDLQPAEHAVAIVGSRAATPQALEVATRLGADLARLGILVVSGLARGVDAAAHRGALRAGGRTVAVLGSGVDVVYPPEHDVLAGEVAASGALVSELPPGTPPLGWHFPRRNRIISGLAAGVVVVEASAHSGSLITAARALDQGRTVMAVPGGVLSGRNRGAHALLKDGARMVETVEDILEELHDVGALARLAAAPGTAPRPPADAVLRAMKAGEIYDVPDLAERTGLDIVRLLARLAELELAGWIRRAGGGRFVRATSDVLR